MKIPSYLKRSRHHIYYFRYVIPDALRPYFKGRCEFKRSLKTRDPRTARRLSHLLAVQVETWLDGVRRKVGMADFEFDPLSSAQRIFYHPKEGLKVETDPNNPADAEQAIRAIEAMAPVLAAKQAQLTVDQRWLLGDDNATAKKPPGRKLDVLVKEYLGLNAHKWKPDTRADYSAALDLFTDKMGNRPITEITRQDIHQFKTKLMETGITPRTVDKKLTVVHGFFEGAIKAGDYADDNPVTGQYMLTNKQKKKNGWKFFSVDDLRLIFDAKVYLAYNTKPHFHWGPLIALYSAMRIEELCQLRLSNLVTEEGVLQFVVTETEPDQSTKSEASVRRVPVHDQLRQLGFERYLADVRELAGEGALLFPYLTRTANGYSKTLSAHFGKYLNAIGITDPKKVFHSLRKAANDKISANKVQEEWRCQLLGHEHENVNSEIYRTPYSAKFLQENVMPHLTFPELDLSGFTYDSAVFRPRLQAELARRRRADARAAVLAQRQVRLEGKKQKS